MDRMHTMAAMALAALAGSAVALADPNDRDATKPSHDKATTTTTRPADKDAYDRDGKIRDQRRMMQDAVLVPMGWVLNKDVMAVGSDEKLGDINDVLLNANTGRVEFVILGSGGVVGIAETERAIPWQAFQWDQAKRELRLPMTQAKLETAPKFNSSDLDTFDDADTRPLYTFYNTNRWDDDGMMHGWGDRRMTTGAKTRADTSKAHGYAPRGYVLASTIRGQDIDRADGTDFGEIEELIVDCQSGRLALVKVDVDDTWRITGDEGKVFLPADMVRLSDSRTMLVNDFEKSLMQKAPNVVEDPEYRYLNDRPYIITVYRYWSSDPTWLDTTGDNTNNPDRRDNMDRDRQNNPNQTNPGTNDPHRGNR